MNQDSKIYKVVIPTDFSEPAWNALQSAIKLYWDKETIFYLVHAYKPFIPNSRFGATSFGSIPIENSAQALADQSLEALKQKVLKSKIGLKHSFETHSTFEVFTEAVKSAIEKYDAEMVVMGTKGVSTVEHVLLGSHTNNLIKSRLHCSVMAIPEHYEFQKPKEIAYATDFKRFISSDSLEPMIQFARTFNSSINVVYVKRDSEPLTEIQEINLNKLQKYLDGVSFEINRIRAIHSVSHTLEIFSDNANVNMLALMSYNHNFIETITREAIIQKVLFDSNIPLLVLSEKKTISDSKDVKNKYASA